MPPIQGWFKSRKPLQASRKKYYEDIFGEKNAEEELEGVHILDSDSDSDPGVFSRRVKRQPREKTKTTLWDNNKNQSDRGDKRGTADGDEIVAPRIDRSTVVTIDDDDSELEEQFVVDLRKHAQGPDNKNDEDDIEGPGNNQNQIDAAFLAEIKKYAAPPPINNQSNDELLDKINGRGENLMDLLEAEYRADGDTAQEFANQSPLGPWKTFEPTSDAASAVPSIEQPGDGRDRETSDEPTDRPSVEEPDDAIDIGAIDGVAVLATGRTSTTSAIREHSWDPSQGSDYVYSDEEADDGLSHANSQGEGLDNSIPDAGDEDEESHIDDAGINEIRNDTHDEQHLRSEVQRESGDETAELMRTRIDLSSGSEDDNDDTQEFIDLTSPIRNSSEGPSIERIFSSKAYKLDLETHDSLTSLEREENSSRTKKRRFGLFASRPSPSIEVEAELSDEEPPRRLRDLVRERAREKEEREVAKKKARYDLRPRQQQNNYDKAPLSRKDASIVEDSDLETDEAEEHQASRRITRSMTINTSARKPIPRWRAARKTAWVTKDDAQRRSLSQHIVQVVVPKTIDRSIWESVPSSTSTPQTERRRLSTVDEDLATLEGEQRIASALAGKGMKRMVPNNINEEGTISNNLDVSRNRKQEIPIVLIE
ncbi:hypothetical protein KCU95_g12089, partial [Aureobasidium melanogenum]